MRYLKMNGGTLLAKIYETYKGQRASPATSSPTSSEVSADSAESKKYNDEHKKFIRERNIQIREKNALIQRQKGMTPDEITKYNAMGINERNKAIQERNKAIQKKNAEIRERKGASSSPASPPASPPTLPQDLNRLRELDFKKRNEALQKLASKEVNSTKTVQARERNIDMTKEKELHGELVLKYKQRLNNLRQFIMTSFSREPPNSRFKTIDLQFVELIDILKYLINQEHFEAVPPPT